MQSSPDPFAPRVTVVVTTRNEERNLPAFLDALDAQTLPRSLFRVILVDNHSTDRTRELARGRMDELLVLGPERSAQRNAGIRAAGTPFVVYLDADMRLSPNVLAECLASLEGHPGRVALYIPETVVGTGYWIRVRNFERSFYDATPIDAVRFIRRDAFLAVGGFDESIYAGEDWELDIRLAAKGSFGIVRSPLYHDEGAFSFRRYLKKKAYYSPSFTDYRAKWPDHPNVRRQFSVWYRFFGVFLENGKWRRFFAHPFLAAGMYLLRFLVGATYLRRR
ncbi:MAG: glycosyltransferase [Kiritimatiellae bacterium]|nr:glycosyltransferase [Kiritimatiellia bacterium]